MRAWMLHVFSAYLALFGTNEVRTIAGLGFLRFPECLAFAALFEIDDAKRKEVAQSKLRP